MGLRAGWMMVIAPLSAGSPVSDGHRVDDCRCRADDGLWMVGGVGSEVVVGVSGGAVGVDGVGGGRGVDAERGEAVGHGVAVGAPEGAAGAFEQIHEQECLIRVEGWQVNLCVRAGCASRPKPWRMSEFTPLASTSQSASRR